MLGTTDNRGLKPTEPFWKSTETSPAGDPSSPRHETEPQPRPANEVDARTMIVGSGMSVSGSIISCDRLIAEGTVDAKLDDCKQVVVAETGVFKGDVSTENADVHGRFEGDLVVRKRLLVRSTGQVSGTITYGEIEIEAGGRISGAIQVDERPKGLGIKRP